MKALARKDDIGLAGEWFQEPVIMESDCADSRFGGEGIEACM